MYIFPGNHAPVAKEEIIVSMVIEWYIYRKLCLNKILTVHGLLSDIKTHLSTLKYHDIKKISLKTLIENLGNDYSKVKNWSNI